MLTELSARKIAPEAKRLEVPAGPPGLPLYLVVQPSGKKSWIVRYRVAGRAVKLTLGSLAAIDLKSARQLARDALVKVAAGRDPHREKVEARRVKQRPMEDDLFERVAEKFLQASSRQVRDRTQAEYRRLLERDVVPRWKGRRIQDIERRDCVALFDTMIERGAGISTNRAYQTLKTFFNWAVGRDLIKFSPIAGLKRPLPETSRDRVLSDDELRRLWLALEQKTEYPVRQIVQLLLLTGARRGEIEGMTWREINLEDRTWLLPSARSKNGRERLTPLSDAAVGIIEKLPRIVGPADFVFTLDGRRPFALNYQAQEKLRRELKFEQPWVIHDVRRTVSTGLHRLGFQPHVCEAVLGHTVATGVAAVYNRHQYADEKRQALDAWAKHVIRNARDIRAVG